MARIPLPTRERLKAVAEARCPNCLQGKIFGGMIRMNDKCPVCGHQFIREQGYFQGAMYVSYGLALGCLFVLTSLMLLVLPSHSELLALGLSVPLFLPIVPVLFRYSRVIWMHLFYKAF